MKNMNNKSTIQLKICPQYERAFDILGKKWHALIIDVLYQKTCRFSEISRAILMMSDRVLTERLKELESVDIVEKVIEPENPKKTLYQLTEKGKTLANATKALKKWSRRWM